MTPYCKNLFQEAHKYVSFPAAMKKIENWDPNAIVTEMFDPKTIAANTYRSWEIEAYKKEVEGLTAYMMELETNNKNLIAIDSRRSTRDQINSLFHEYQHHRFKRFQYRHPFWEKSVFIDASNRKKEVRMARLIEVLLDELMAFTVAEAFVPVAKKQIENLSIVKKLKDSYTESNTHFRDFIALLFITEKRTGISVDKIKSHQIVLVATKTSWEQIDKTMDTKEYRVFRKNLYELLKRAPEYEY